MSAASRTAGPDLLAPPQDERIEPGDGLFHLYCCAANRALCGADLQGVPETEGEGEGECAVCFDLDAVYARTGCPVCGQP